MTNILIVHAHPHPKNSRANRTLLECVRDLPNVKVHSLYEKYPDVAIDVEAERTSLEQAQLVVFQHPIYWYSMPGLLKLWFDEVFSYGWAYGPEGNALQGKRCLWVLTTGGDINSYSSAGVHGFNFKDFLIPLQQTALFCGMEWLQPLIIHNVNHLDTSVLAEYASAYKNRLIKESS